MRGLVLAGVVAVAASLVTGCGRSGPERVLSQPPAPAQTGAAMPLDRVDRPVDLAKFDADPCGLLTKDQVAAVVADPPDGVFANRLTAFGCSWGRPVAAHFTAVKPVQEPRTLAELAVSNLKKSGDLEPWTETSIDGLPAVVYHEFGNLNECSVSVQVTADQMLTFGLLGKDLPDSYWDKDRCGGAAKLAESVLGKLRQG
ncbi:DUF3558 domain-containing protein [Amycolatopsis eburnea]|uniref:DUF3558 domain-containing protein n=1 Tax=Amycolatopsis eburnea TaxID=2267691 RepID=A0A3R9E4H9_9PSEU|nr:DUF3558 domain-containing protein [Amycolatopsis eburnea]RSD19715.1 DUF3558 domain-containing protein [Amycolatopsis eburnea]